MSLVRAIMFILRGFFRSRARRTGRSPAAGEAAVPVRLRDFSTA